MSGLSPFGKSDYQKHHAVKVYLPRLGPSFGWLITMCAAYLLGSMMYGIYLGAVEGYSAARAGAGGMDSDAISAAVESALQTPGGVAGMYLFQFLFVVPVIYWASNFSQQSWLQTLAIKPIRLELLKRYILILIGFLVAEVLIATQFELDGGQFTKLVQGSQHLGLAIVISLLAPIMEEAIFRGYMFGAWRHTRLGFSGTLLLTSLLFTLLHYGQYSLPILAFLFVFSMILGFARERSGSLLLPIVLHGINNLLSVITVLYLGMDF